MKLLCYCREGFEATVADEARARHQLVRAGPGGPAFVTFAPGASETALDVAHWIFARQVLLLVGEVNDLSERDRLTPIVHAIRQHGEPFCELVVETADTNEGRTRSRFLSRFAPLLEEPLHHLLQPRARHRLHVFFASATQAFIAMADPQCTSPWPMGVPRLRIGGAAPSRSAAKLAEAFHVLVGDRATEERIVAGRRAVDLGAAPGGWSWWLAQRGLRVVAVDNGPLKGAAHGHDLIEPVHADGFRYRWRGVVDWLTCDMVEQPRRIAQLVATHMAEGRARNAIFNLKLPMKKRWEEIELCERVIAKAMAGIPHRLAMKQLYHDREEVSAWLTRTDAL